MNLQYAQSAPQTLYIKENTHADFLDDVLNMLLSGDIDAGMGHLGDELYKLYVRTTSKDWKNLVNDTLLRHPLSEILMQDPLTSRSFNKPRGHSGDATLLDMIYFPNKTDLSGVSKLGKQIYKHTAQTQVCKSLSARMRTVAGLIDHATVCYDKPNVLSIASGHCREAEFSDAIKNKKLGKMVAVDSDIKCMESLRQNFEPQEIQPVCASISDLINGKLDLGKFDLIYSSGLYDYLSTRFAKKLTSHLYNMLAPGGKLALFNIESNYKEIGYIESYMNWEMIGRDKQELLELVSEIDGLEVATLNIQTNGRFNSHFNSIEIQKN